MKRIISFMLVLAILLTTINIYAIQPIEVMSDPDGNVTLLSMKERITASQSYSNFYNFVVSAWASAIGGYITGPLKSFIVSSTATALMPSVVAGDIIETFTSITYNRKNDEFFYYCHVKQFRQGALINVDVTEEHARRDDPGSARYRNSYHTYMDIYRYALSQGGVLPGEPTPTLPKPVTPPSPPSPPTPPSPPVTPPVQPVTIPTWPVTPPSPPPSQPPYNPPPFTPGMTIDLSVVSN